MKKAWKITTRALLALGLLLYVAVALVNYSVVQSYLGAAVGHHFSKEWGAEVRIGALHAMPFDHVILDNVLLVDPEGDTVFRGETLRVGFKRFPFRNHGLELDHVYLRNAYYHLVTGGGKKINLQFIIDYFKPKEPKEKDGTPKQPFTVTARLLELEGVHYKMDLPDNRKTVYPYGVQIPHMEYLDIHGKFRNIKVVNDDITCRIVHMRTREQSGFTVNEMRGQVHVSRYEIVAKDFEVYTANSAILFDGEMHYDTWKGMKGYLSTVQHKANIKKGTRVAMSDVAYWAPILWGIDMEADIEGTAHGTIDSLTADLEVRWGRQSGAQMAGSIVGLPRIDTTEFDLEVERLYTNREDVESWLQWLKFPEKLKHTIGTLGQVDLVASLHGGWRDAAAVNLTMQSTPGLLEADATLKQTAQGHSFTLDANSPGMGLEMLGTDWITRSGFDISTQGTLRTARHRGESLGHRINAEVEGHLTHSMVKGRPLGEATINGALQQGLLTAHIESSDSLATIDLTAVGDLRDSTNKYLVKADIGNLDLGLLPHPLATHLEAQGCGNDIETFAGTITVTNIRYGTLKMEQMQVNLQADNGLKSMQLTSDMADATLYGMFRYNDLPLMARHMASQYLPEMFNTQPRIDSTELERMADNTLTFHLNWKDDGRRLRELTESVGIARGTRLDASYNSGEQLKLVLRSDSLRLGPVVLDNVGASGRTMGDSYRLDVEAQSLGIGQITLLDGLNANVNSKPELATLGLQWGDNESTTHGDLMLGLEGNELRVFRPWFYVGSTQWELSADTLRLTQENNRLCINGWGLGAASEQQLIDGRLALNGKDNDCVELNFNRFSLNLLGEVLLQETPFDVEGDISGRFTLYGLTATPYFNANLQVDSCVVNRQPLGHVELKSNWNAELNIVNLEVNNQQLRALGWVGLGKEDADLNFNVAFNGFELALAKPFLQSFSSHLAGQLHGNLDIRGTLKQPDVLGEARVDGGALRVDMTEVTYYFDDSIRFHGNTFTLNGFRIRDALGNTATALGTLKYTDQQTLEIDLGVRTDNLLVLDKKSGDQFYGTLLASADGRVSGTPTRLDIAVRARTNPGCELTIPVSYQQQVKSQNYITFVSDQPEYESESDADRRQSNLRLELDLNITPDVKLNLPMDFNEVTVGVGAQGSGDLHVGIRGNNTPQIMGAYEITSGTMKVGLLSVYEKAFTIESGSNLNFQGNAPDARFDLRAVYSQRVNMSTLTGSLSSIDNTQKYLQVENIIAINGTLQDPTISFDLRLPGADQSVEDEVFAYIDRNSERDMLNQTVSLLLGGSFYNVSNNNMPGTNPLDIVTSFVGNSLSDMVQFVDVDVSYKSATEMTNEQFDVNISKDWGRWYLESTLGYGGDSRELEASNINGAVIDALIGYRLSPLVHLFAYNRTNTNDYTRIDLPYKQGAGIKLTKDFDRWSDLFRRKNKETRR